MASNIIEQIKKLFALSTSDNVNEAAAAAAAAQRLMTKHRIEMAEVESHASTSGPAAPDVVHEEMAREKSRIPWKESLAYGLCKANGCEMYTSLGNGAVTMYIGPRSSLETIKYMYAYLIREVDRLANAEKKIVQAQPKGYVDRTYLTSFRLGAANTIRKRLIEEAIQQMCEAPAGALVVINQSNVAVQKIKQSINLRMTKNNYGSRDGYAAGQAAGKTVNLSAGKPLGKGSAGNIKG